MKNQYNFKDINKATLQSFLNEKTIQEIADFFNVHRDTIRRKIVRFKLKKKFGAGQSSKKVGPECARFAKKNGVARACEKFNKTEKQVEKYLQKLKYGEYKDEL